MTAATTSGRTLRVAFYMHDFSAGGVERMRLALFAALGGRGILTHAIVHALRGPLVAELPQGTGIIVLGRCRTMADVPLLARLLRQGQFDIVISNLDHNNIILLLARLIAGRKTKVIICQHNALSREVALGWKYRLVPLFYRLLWRFADAVVAVSSGVADDLSAIAHIPRDAICIISNPVVGTDVGIRAAAPAPHPWLTNRTLPTFLFVGRLTAQKDPETLLRAFALRLRSGPARLILLGEGELAHRLQSLAQALGVADSVCFAGFHRDPLPWMRRADALVCSSSYEGLGNVIIEALACGTPVIATDCNFGPGEILQGGKFGRLVPVGDSRALAAALAGMPSDPCTAAERQSRASEFSVAACVDKHIALFSGIMARRPRRLFGLTFARMEAAECARLVLAGPTSDLPQLLVTPNIDHVRLLHRRDFAAACRSAALVCADGFPLVAYARVRGIPLRSRLTGCDIMHQLARDPGLAAQRIFVIVESEATQRAAEAWATRLGIAAVTKITVAPAQLLQNEVGQCALSQAAAAHGTTLLVMTLGAPVSELFVHRNRDLLPSCWALCVGQAFRVELGLVARSPLAWRARGLEWLWRLSQEPRRLAPRYLLAAAWFPVALLMDMLSLKRPEPFFLEKNTQKTFTNLS